MGSLVRPLGAPSIYLTLAVVTLAADQVSGVQVSDFDRSVYGDAVTAALIQTARARHQGRSLQLAGYRANAFTRVEARMGESRFAPGITVFAYETAAKVHWAYPGNVKVDVQGARMAAPRLPGLSTSGQVASFWEDLFGHEPWFVPGAMGDEIQLMGIPDEEALHPLARGAEAFYRYARIDSVELVLPNRTVHAVAVRVEPRVPSPTMERHVPERVDTVPASFNSRLSYLIDSVATANRRDPGAVTRVDWRFIADSLRRVQPGDSIIVLRRPARVDVYEPTLVSGEMWLDADSLDVVRLSVAFVGNRIWDDDPDAPELVNLEADLEYGLHEGRYWLPLRQILTANFVYKYLPGVRLPASSVTTFSDHLIDETTTEFAFSVTLPEGISGRRFGDWNCPDAWEFDRVGNEACGESAVTRLIRDRASGNTWEITLPPRDSLLNFDFDREFAFTTDLASERFLNERFSHLARISEQVPADARSHARLVADWIQVYDVFGFNRVQGPSLGFGYNWDPGIDFTTIRASGRFGFDDQRPIGSLTWRRESPSGRFEASAFRSMSRVEPRGVGAGVGGALRTLFLARDEADYYLATGVELTYTGFSGPLQGLRVAVAAERQRSVSAVTGSWLNDFLLGSGAFPPNPSILDDDYARLSLFRQGRLGPVNVQLGMDALSSQTNRAARFWTASDVWFATGSRLVGNIRVGGGVMGGDSLPQVAFRVGGRNSVRGHSYGTLRGTTFWSGQLDLEWIVNQWWSPVVHFDAGNTGRFTDPLLGVGAGVAFLSGLVRFDLSKGMNPSRGVIFDLHFQIPRL